MRLKDKVAIITGAASGMGEAMAYNFAKQGAKVVTTDIQAEKLFSIVNKIKSNQGEALGIEHDVSNRSDWFDRVILNTLSAYGHIDILINNAGISHIGLLQDLTNDDWHEVLNTNLSSIFYTSKKSIPLFLKQGFGKIINLSSVWGNQGASCEVAYCASKGGVNAFTEALGKELALSNIQVNAIACGLIDTSMNAHLTSDEIAALKNEIPSNRMGTTDEVADLTLYLLNAPTYLTGQVITLDGGWQ